MSHGSPFRHPGAGPALALALGCSVLAVPGLSAQSTPDPRSVEAVAGGPVASAGDALPFDLAFDMREFVWSTVLAVSSDGAGVAYAVRQTPPDVNLDARFMPNGSPSGVVGARVYVTDRRAGTTVDVCEGGSCWRPSWSPDGSRLAFYSDRDGPPQLWVYEAATGRSRRVSPVRIKAKLWAGDEAQWSPDGGTVFVPVAPESGPGAWLPDPDDPDGGRPGDSSGPTVTVLKSGSEADAAPDAPPAPLMEHFLRENSAALAAIDVATGEVRMLASADAEPRPSVLRVSPSGRWVSYLSVFTGRSLTDQVSTFDLAVLPAAGGGIEVVATELPMLRDYHRLNYAWHPTQDRLVYFKDGGLWLVDVGARGPSAPRRLATELGPLAPTVHWFTRDGRALVVGVDPIDDRDYGDVRPGAIAVVPLDGGRSRRVEFGDGWVFQDVIRTDGRTVWQPEPGTVTLVLTETATGELGVVRVDFGTGASRVLWKGLGRFGNLTSGGSHDFVMSMFENLATPPNVYRFSADFGDRERVSHIDPRLDAVGGTQVEIFETTVPIHDGGIATVRTAVLLPPGARRGDRLPGIVMIYPGGDRTSNAARFGGGGDLTVPNLLFTSRGYAVILTHVRLGPNREAGNPLQEMVDVLLPQIYRAAELGYVDAGRLAVGGQSYGGYGTAAVVSGTNLFRAAIAVNGIYDLPGTYGHMRPDGGSFWVGWSEGGQARMGTHPWADLRRYIDNSPYYRADKIHTPLLIVHGAEDMAYHDGQKLFSALRRLDRPGQLLSYAGEGHVIWNWSRANAVDAAARMVEFLRNHIGDPMARTAQVDGGGS